MKKVLILLSLLLPAYLAGAQGRFDKYLDQAEGAPFIVIDKQAFTLTLVNPQGSIQSVMLPVSGSPYSTAQTERIPWRRSIQ